MGTKHLIVVGVWGKQRCSLIFQTIQLNIGAVHRKKQQLENLVIRCLTVTFASVHSGIDETKIKKIADQEVGRIVSFAHQSVMCQGEFTLTYAIVERLKSSGIKCVAACSNRDVDEYTDKKGNRKKKLGMNSSGSENIYIGMSKYYG